MRLSQAIEIYQRAIDPTKGVEQGSDWWAEVEAELSAVVAAPTTTAGSDVIAWWHNDWRQVGDTPTRAAGRIRKHAARVLNA